MAFFRMKLHGEYVLAGHRRGEPYAVLGCSCDIDRLSRIDIVAMHKIEPGVLINALPQRMQATLRHIVPPHVRDFQPDTCSISDWGKPAHSAWQNTQTCRAAIFIAVIKQCLQSQANTQHRTGFNGTGNHIVQTSAAQRIQPGSYGTLPGQNHMSGIADTSVFCGNRNPGTGGNFFKRLGYRM